MPITTLQMSGKVLQAICLFTISLSSMAASGVAPEVKPVSEEQAHEYTLGPAFYKKCTLVQNILPIRQGCALHEPHLFPKPPVETMA